MEIVSINNPSFEEVKVYIDKCNNFYENILQNNEEKDSSSLDVSFQENAPLTIIKNTSRQRVIDGFNYLDSHSYYVSEDQLSYNEVYTIYKVNVLWNARNINLTELGDAINKKNSEIDEVSLDRLYNLIPHYNAVKNPSDENPYSIFFQVSIYRGDTPLFHIEIHYEGKLTIISSPEKSLTENDLSILDILYSHFSS